MTRSRVAVLSAVHDHPYADTDPIIGVVRGDLGAVSHQVVYDVLRALTAAGPVRRFQPTGFVVRYEPRVGDSHRHVVCRSCGAIADVDRAVGYTVCLTAADDSGYEFDEAEVIYWGQVPRVSRHLLPRPAADRRYAALETSRAIQPWDLEQPTSRATSHQNETARRKKDRRV